MEIVDKKYSIEDDAKEYLDRCEEVYQGERTLLYSIAKQCSDKTLVGRYSLAKDTQEFNKNIYHFVLPSGLHVYSNDKHGKGVVSNGMLVLSHELPPEVLQNPKSFLQLMDGADAFVRWGEAGHGAWVADDYITCGINGHCTQNKFYEHDFSATSDIEAAIISAGYRYGNKGHKPFCGKYSNSNMMISNNRFTALDLSEPFENLPDVLKGIISELSIPDQEKQEHYQKIEPLFKMLEIERMHLQEQVAKKTPLEKREEELSLLESTAREYDKVEALKNQIEQSEVQGIGE